MKIAVDAMGGDHAPREIVRGAVESARANDLPLILVGREARVRAEWGAGGVGGFLIPKKIRGVDRPAIAATIPTPHGPVVLVDAGANVESKPAHLLQFGYMGEAYSRMILGIPRPRVGVVSIGAEDSKGTDLTRDTCELFRRTGLNFVGNVEGRDFFAGQAEG